MYVPHLVAYTGNMADQCGIARDVTAELPGRARAFYRPVSDTACATAQLFCGLARGGCLRSFALTVFFCENNDFHDDGKTRTQVLSPSRKNVG